MKLGIDARSAMSRVPLDRDTMVLLDDENVVIRHKVCAGYFERAELARQGWLPLWQYLDMFPFLRTYARTWSGRG